MNSVYWFVSVLLVVVLLAVIAQEVRYLRWRRDIAADRQSLFHSSRVFHVATVVSLSAEQELLPAIREFVEASEAAGGKVIYAGKIADNGLRSNQIPDEEWHAFLLTQFASPQAYSHVSSSPSYQKVRAGFAASYALGMRRSPWLNLALPIGLLGMRAVDIVRRRPARYPFEKASPSILAQMPPEQRARRASLVAALLANFDYGKEAVVVLNFIKHGSAAQRAADSAYGRQMMSMMAEMGNGPTHLGRAVTLEGDAEFDQVAIVYYPGVEYFAEMLESGFFTSIVGDKQLGDSLSSPSVPLLPHL
jgi:hypothetical protein